MLAVRLSWALPGILKPAAGLACDAASAASKAHSSTAPTSSAPLDLNLPAPLGHQLPRPKTRQWSTQHKLLGAHTARHTAYALGALPSGSQQEVEAHCAPHRATPQAAPPAAGFELWPGKAAELGPRWKGWAP